MGVNMKKIIICLFCLIAFNAHATEMCARRDITVVPLDATVAGGGGLTQFDQTEWIWWGNPSYGKIYGTATCLALQEIRDISGDQTIKITGVGGLSGIYTLPTDDYELMGRYGYYNGDTSIPENERKYCFCKLTHPMSSQWVINIIEPDMQWCKTRCMDVCGRHAGDPEKLEAMFRSIGK